MLLSALLALLVGGAAGYSYTTVINKRKAKSASDEATKILADAKSEAKKITLDAKSEALKLAEESKREEKERRNTLNQTEQQLLQRQGSLDQKLE